MSNPNTTSPTNYLSQKKKKENEGAEWESIYVQPCDIFVFLSSKLASDILTI